MGGNSTDKNHLKALGLKDRHISSVEPSALTNLLCIVGDAYPKKYMSCALAEPGYWAAHLLQPFCKTDILKSAFEKNVQQLIVDLSSRYVDYYLFHCRDKSREKRSRRAAEGLVGGTIDARTKSYKVLQAIA